MSSEAASAITVRDVGKCYELYDKPSDRLRQFILPRFRRDADGAPKRYYREFWALRGVSFEIWFRRRLSGRMPGSDRGPGHSPCGGGRVVDVAQRPSLPEGAAPGEIRPMPPTRA